MALTLTIRVRYFCNRGFAAATSPWAACSPVGPAAIVLRRSAIAHRFPRTKTFSPLHKAGGLRGSLPLLASTFQGSLGGMAMTPDLR